VGFEAIWDPAPLEEALAIAAAMHATAITITTRRASTLNGSMASTIMVVAVCRIEPDSERDCHALVEAFEGLHRGLGFACRAVEP
jgi:hypothetical protein